MSDKSLDKRLAPNGWTDLGNGYKCNGMPIAKAPQDFLGSLEREGPTEAPLVVSQFPGNGLEALAALDRFALACRLAPAPLPPTPIDVIELNDDCSLMVKLGAVRVQGDIKIDMRPSAGADIEVRLITGDGQFVTVRRPVQIAVIARAGAESRLLCRLFKAVSDWLAKRGFGPAEI